MDTYRSSGAGGQHVNVTDSAVRITHMPSGIVVSCQNERSQIRNREVAMKILKARLYELEMQKRKAKLDAVEAAKKDIAFGSQIRSYVLHPYRMVKDLRTKHETGDLDRVLDGDLDDFIKATLVARAKGTLGSRRPPRTRRSTLGGGSAAARWQRGPRASLRRCLAAAARRTAGVRRRARLRAHRRRQPGHLRRARRRAGWSAASPTTRRWTRCPASAATAGAWSSARSAPASGSSARCRRAAGPRAGSGRTPSVE